MSAAVISSLVRCDEWDRKYEKEDKTPQKRRRGCAGWGPAKSNVAFGEKNKGGAERGESRATDKLTGWHEYQHTLDLTPAELYSGTAGHERQKKHMHASENTTVTVFHWFVCISQCSTLCSIQQLSRAEHLKHLFKYENDANEIFWIRPKHLWKEDTERTAAENQKKNKKKKTRQKFLLSVFNHLCFSRQWYEV